MSTKADETVKRGDAVGVAVAAGSPPVSWEVWAELGATEVNTVTVATGGALVHPANPSITIPNTGNSMRMGNKTGTLQSASAQTPPVVRHLNPASRRSWEN